jgi:hypothetical protein
VLLRVWGVTSFRVRKEEESTSGAMPLPKWMTLPFIVQGGPSLWGVGRKKERDRDTQRERERESPYPAGQDRELYQPGSLTPSVGVLLRPLPKSCVMDCCLVLSLYVMLCQSGGGHALTSTVVTPL